MRPFRSSLLRRYIALNLCIVLIPMTIFLLFFYREMEQRFIREIESAHVNMLTQSVAAMDADINALRMTASRISGDIMLSPYLFRGNTYASIETIQRLRIYGAQLGFIDNLMLYIYGDNKLYTSIGTYLLGDFTDYIYTFTGDWGRDDLIVQMRRQDNLTISGRGRYIRHAASPSQPAMMVLTMPWARGGGTPFGSINALIPAAYFEQVINIKTDIPNATLILDGEGEILFQKGIPLDVKGAVTNLNEHDKTDVQRIEMNREGYSRITKRSDETGWRFVTLIPHRYLSSRVQPLNLLTILLISMIFALSIAIGVFLAYRNWLPIRRISTNIRGASVPGKPINELMEIDSALQSLLLDQAENDRRMKEESKRLTQIDLLNTLLQHDEVIDASFEARLSAAGVILDGPAYCVLSISANRFSPLSRSGIIESANHLEGVYAVDRVYKDSIAIVINVENGEGSPHQRVLCDLEARSGELLICGVGRHCRTLAAVGRSLTESVLALEACRRMSEQTTLTYDEMEAHCKKTQNADQLQISLLIQAIRQCNLSLIDKYLGIISDMLSLYHASQDHSMLRYFTHIIVYELTNLAADCSMPESDIFMMRLINHQLLPEYISTLKEYCTCLLDVFQKRIEASNNRIFESILAFVDEHYVSPDMSLQLLSEQFNLSIQYMSHFFRAKSGSNFIEYIIQRRMNRACELLVSTEKRIHEICEEVGYHNVPSFTRKFTEMYGMNPSRYRVTFRKGQGLL